MLQQYQSATTDKMHLVCKLGKIPSAYANGLLWEPSPQPTRKNNEASYKHIEHQQQYIDMT